MNEEEKQEALKKLVVVVIAYSVVELFCLMFGYHGLASAKATESYTKYVIVDMYAKAVQGMKAEDAVQWAEGELKKIYEG